jgi:hypothetical protein
MLQSENVFLKEAISENNVKYFILICISFILFFYFFMSQF